ncbi:MAG: hypothetical protein WC795_03345 [Candidatus Paceibacterota bacterium]|jgi:hypothetical protein
MKKLLSLAILGAMLSFAPNLYAQNPQDQSRKVLIDPLELTVGIIDDEYPNVLGIMPGVYEINSKYLNKSVEDYVLSMDQGYKERKVYLYTFYFFFNPTDSVYFKITTRKPKDIGKVCLDVINEKHVAMFKEILDKDKKMSKKQKRTYLENFQNLVNKALVIYKYKTEIADSLSELQSRLQIKYATQFFQPKVAPPQQIQKRYGER